MKAMIIKTNFKSKLQVISVIFALMLLGTTYSYSQCTVCGASCGTTPTAMGNCAFATGDGAEADGDYGIGMGQSATAVGDYSIAIGSSVVASGTSSIAIGDAASATTTGSCAIGSGTADGSKAYAIGPRVLAYGDNSFALGDLVYSHENNNYNYIFGRGATEIPSYMINNITNSMMFGMNSTLPTLFIEGSSGSGTWGKIGIGTTDPDGILHVLEESADNTDFVIEKADTKEARTVFHNGSTEAAYISLNASEDLMVKNKTSDKDIIFNINDGGSDAEVMRIDGSQRNVGIGTSAPLSKLHIMADAVASGSENITSFTVPDAADDYLRIQNITGVDNRFAPGIIGYTKSNQGLSSLYLLGEIFSSNDAGTTPIITFNARRTGAAITTRPIFSWSNYGTTTMLMDANGNLGIGTTNPTDLLYVNGNSASKLSTATWTIISDENLKTDISDFTDGLNVLQHINPIWFRYNGIGGLPTDLLSVGVRAQEVNDVAPYMIETGELEIDTTTHETMEILKYNANALFYLLLNATKELDDRTTDIAAMADQLTDLTESYTILSNQYSDLVNEIQNCCNSSGGSYKFDGTGNGVQTITENNILQVFPNPFETETTISYNIKQQYTQAYIIIVDASGRLVHQIPAISSEGSVTLTNNDLAAGIYFCSLKVNEKNIGSQRIVKIK